VNISRSQANGSTPLALALLTSEYITAAERPPRGLPTNRKFFLLWKAFHKRNYVNMTIMLSDERITRRFGGGRAA